MSETTVNKGFFTELDAALVRNPVPDAAIALQTLTRNGRVGGRLYVFKGNGVWQEYAGDPYAYYVDPVNGLDTNSGRDWDLAFKTLQAAINARSGFIGQRIYLRPGRYDESVTIPRTNSNLSIIGAGGRGACYIDPSTEDATGLEVRADDVTLVNVGVAGEDEDAAFALKVSGARFRAYGCKFEGAADQVIIGPGTIAQIDDDGTHGDGADGLFVDCEFCWGVDGLIVTSSDYGACTQLRLRDCHFHNLSGVELGENDAGVIGAGRNVWVDDCIFDNAEDGTAPSKYIDLDSAGTTGRIVRPSFLTDVLAAAKIGLAAGVLIVDWHTEAEGAPATGGTSGRPD